MHTQTKTQNKIHKLYTRPPEQPFSIKQKRAIGFVSLTWEDSVGLSTSVGLPSATKCYYISVKLCLEFAL